MGQVDEFRKKFLARPRLYGSTLMEMETIWYMIRWTQDIVLGRLDWRLSQRAYFVIHQKYKCGNWHLATKTAETAKKKGWDEQKAAETLLKRLQEVETVEQQMRDEVEAYHFNATLEQKVALDKARWIGYCKEFPSYSFVAELDGADGRDFAKALAGIKSVIAELIDNMRQHGEDIPMPQEKP